ncbi:MAG: hypothetical protein Q8930_15905 [Bacillota bacterium]|nr:hypothetical protein [Bacillota bacterium]
MKVKIISVLLIFLLSISITGCSGREVSSNSSNSKSENTKAQNQSNKSVLEAYKAVLQNKAEFVDTDYYKIEMNLNDFLTNEKYREGKYYDPTLKETYKSTLKVTQFTMVNIDGDTIPEVVVKLSEGDLPIYYEIFHYMNDTVYGYLMSIAGTINLKADGTFCYDSHEYEGKMSFTQYTYDYELSKVASSPNKLFEKKDPVWYEFSQENIETELSANP